MRMIWNTARSHSAPIALGLLTSASILVLACERCDGEAPAAPEAASPATEAKEAAEKPPGNWRVAKQRGGAPSEPLDETTRRRMEELAALGYLQGYNDAPEKVGVTRHDPERALNGYNLVLSGHAQEATLIDMRGDVVHSWSYDGSSYYPMNRNRKYWRRAHLTQNGELYVICDPHGIIKLDKDSKLIWATTGDLHLHHDLSVTDDGRIYTLGKTFRLRPELNPTKEMIIDLAVEIDEADGSVIKSFELYESFEGTPFLDEVASSIRATGDELPTMRVEDFHTNTIKWFDGAHASISNALQRGNLLFASPYRHVSWIIDPESQELVWCWFGPWTRIHDPTITSEGHLMLFHNDGYEGPNGRVSQVLEYDFASRKEVWRYQGNPADPDSEFLSATSSTATRLANGNTLIVATESGRAIEVTPGGDIVWEFFNPRRAGEENELIAALFQVLRVPVEQTQTWLD
jgi:hypothetical protein